MKGVLLFCIVPRVKFHGYKAGEIFVNVGSLGSHSFNMITPLDPLLSVALEGFGELSWESSSGDASRQLSSAVDNMASDNIPSSSVSTPNAAYSSSQLKSIDLFGASPYDTAVKTTTKTDTFLQPTSAGITFASEAPVAMNGVAADSPIVASMPAWTLESTNFPSQYTSAIITTVLLGIILLILLVFSILLCRRVRRTNHHIEGGIQIAVGPNKLQNIQLPAMPLSPIVRDF